MNPCFNQLKKFLAQYGYSDSDLNQLISLCSVVSFNKGDIIIHAGVSQSQIYFINSGLVRNYIFTESAEIKTINFRMENMTATGYAHYNYNNELKSIVNVECLESCQMVKIPLAAVKFMLDNCTIGEKVGRHLAEAHVMELANFIIDRETKSLLNRYYDLENIFPGIHQRVPQHIIASYLGTTAVHMSRIKNAKTRR
jgi:CRP-like cAMP-binding protein